MVFTPEFDISMNGVRDLLNGLQGGQDRMRTSLAAPGPCVCCLPVEGDSWPAWRLRAWRVGAVGEKNMVIASCREKILAPLHC